MRAAGPLTARDLDEVRRFGAFLADAGPAAGQPGHDPTRKVAAYAKHYPDATREAPMTEMPDPMPEFTVDDVAAVFLAANVLADHLDPDLIRRALPDRHYDALQRARAVIIAEPAPGGPPGMMTARTTPFRVTGGTREDPR